MSELKTFNLNDRVRVKITDAGIRHYVQNHNNDMPFEFHLSFSQFKDKAKSDGYHVMQMHEFMGVFGGKFTRIADLVDLNIQFFEKDFEVVS